MDAQTVVNTGRTLAHPYYVISFQEIKGLGDAVIGAAMVVSQIKGGERKVIKTFSLWVDTNGNLVPYTYIAPEEEP